MDKNRVQTVHRSICARWNLNYCVLMHGIGPGFQSWRILYRINHVAMLKLALHTLSLPCVCPVFPSFQAIMDFAGKYGSVDLATLDFTLRCQSCDDWESAIRQQQALFERACACGSPLCTVMRKEHPNGAQARPLATASTQRRLELAELNLAPEIIEHVMALRSTRHPKGSYI